jgi:uncharacterized protein (DUF1697 family)
MSEFVALLRGINVGRAKRIGMADLRDLVAKLGHTEVRTLLNSGNVVFRSRRSNAAKLAAEIEKAIKQTCGFTAAVTVVAAKELISIIDENPLLHIAKDPARHLVVFVSDTNSLTPLRPMLKEKWAPDALAITRSAAYLWCATGILESKLNLAFSRKAGTTITARNWATVLKLKAALQPGSSA